MTTSFSRILFLLGILINLPGIVVGATANAGQKVTLAATATGTAPFRYQWFKDGTAISGATSASYVINSFSSSHTGNYTVTMTNAAGSATSSSTSLTVINTVTAPSITTQPTGHSVNVGSSTSFSVVSSGTAPLVFQWSKNGTAIPGATSATYTIAEATSADAGNYSVTVTNAGGSVTSSAAQLTVNAVIAAPTIVSHPASQSALTGSSATFSVTASGSGLSYQWKKGTANIAGATSSTLTLNSVSIADAASYSVVVTNSAGSVTSTAATLTITTVVAAPTIASSPQSATISEGTPLSLSVSVSGTAPFTYQWRRSGINIIGATDSTYSVPVAELTDAGSYTVVVTNSAGSATSAVANIIVNAAPVPATIVTQPSSKSVIAGSTTTFTVKASGSGPLTYQWVYNDVDIPGATSPSYTLTAVQPGDSGNYVVVVRNAYGMDISTAAVLTVDGVANGGNVVIIGDSDPVTDDPISTPSNDDSGTRLSNLSVRSVAGRGGNPLIVGLTMTGASSKQVLVRATGPALAAFGVGGTLADPNLKVYDNGAEIASNDDWGSSSQSVTAIGVKVGAFPLVDTSSKDTALVTTMSGSRTVHVNSARSNESGVVLVEAYDAGSGSSTRMTNASARNYCGTGSDVLVLGFTIEGASTRKVLVRAVGPGLQKFGVSGVLQDPKIELHKLSGGSANLIDANDNWGGSSTVSAAFTQAGAFGLDATSKDAALVATLPAGAYTLTVSGVNNGTGEALVEIYELQ